MKRMVMRTLIGLIWLAAAAACLFQANDMMAVVGLAAGAAYLYAACSMWKRKASNERNDI